MKSLVVLLYEGPLFRSPYLLYMTPKLVNLYTSVWAYYVLSIGFVYIFSFVVFVAVYFLQILTIISRNVVGECSLVFVCICYGNCISFKWADVCCMLNGSFVEESI